ncbi:hypothetical protein HBI60_215040 [Parastagonospora nodorum]|nr:hypothetical protein HBI54_180780 [Parastagonospora nodorum]KAH6386738.1 hypothetical protein HBI60_215040 [Parastagonospora nodorum]
MVLSGIHSIPQSSDLGRLVQDRLKIVNQQFPALAPDTLNDFRIVADELSTIARICQTTINRLAAQSETNNAVKAFKDTERALDWAEFLAAVKVDQLPSQRTLLFRAHDQPATDQSGMYTSAAHRIPFNDNYRQRKSVQEFLKSLGMHLGKKAEEAKAGKIMKTKFTSTSPRLEWTLHLTGKKSGDLQEQVNFVIFDLQALRETPETTVFHVADVLRFLEMSKQTHLIPTNYQQWARNCDEYIIMGRGIEKGIVQITPWSELRWTPIINDTFRSTFTLFYYERFRDDRMGAISQTEHGQACEMVVSTARVMAGQKAEDMEFVQHLVHLILKPGLWFWGIHVSGDDAEIVEACDQLLGDGLAARMSQISI